jgi:hypothetical protein
MVLYRLSERKVQASEPLGGKAQKLTIGQQIHDLLAGMVYKKRNPSYPSASNKRHALG